MQKKLIAAALAASFLAPVAFADEAKGPHSFSGNFTLASDYIFRGISQSQHKPAVQGGLDYEHSSGLYVGTWASNVGWVDDVAKRNNSMEWDFYAGYKNEIGPISYDVGAIRYYYPGDKMADTASPDSTEIYLGLGWEFLEFKYSHAVSKHLFGWVGDNDRKTRGSNYTELNASFEFDGGWGVSAHLGHQSIKNYSKASYTDWSLGVTKDVGFGTVGLTYTDSDADGNCNKSEPYCFGSNPKNAAGSRAVLSFSKEF